MRRRDLVLGAGCAVALSVAARAQQKPMPVIGFLGSGSLDNVQAVIGALRQGLADTGYVEGQNVAIEYRWAEGRYDRLPAMAADLVGRKVDLIVTLGGTPSALAAKSVTSTIPIVFTFVSNPVGVGLVVSLARPGDTITGVSGVAVELTPKRFQLLCEMVPQARVIALLVHPNNASHESLARDLEEAGRTQGVQLRVLKAGSANEIDAAFASLVQLETGALILAPDGFFASRTGQIVRLAARHAVPAIYPFGEFAAAGGLISYGINFAALSRQAGVYVGRILKGENPANLPVQQPTKFEMVINMKTAKALGLTVPQSLLARADEVIE